MKGLKNGTFLCLSPKVKNVSSSSYDLKYFLAILFIAHTECLEEAQKNTRKSARAVTSKPAILLGCGQSNLLQDKCEKHFKEHRSSILKVWVLKSFKKVLS